MLFFVFFLEVSGAGWPNWTREESHEGEGKGERPASERARKESKRTSWSAWVLEFWLWREIFLISLYLFFASHQQIQNIFNAWLHVSFMFPVVALEEQKANLNRELSTLRHTHNKVRRSSNNTIQSHDINYCAAMSNLSFYSIVIFIILQHIFYVLSYSWLTHIGNFRKEEGILKRIPLWGCFYTPLFHSTLMSLIVSYTRAFIKYHTFVSEKWHFENTGQGNLIFYDLFLWN